MSFRFLPKWLPLGALLTLLAVPAHAEDGSVTGFVRGGSTFATSPEDPISSSPVTFSIGARKSIGLIGDSLEIEGEIFGSRDDGSVSEWIVAPTIGLRYSRNAIGPVDVYASVGVGVGIREEEFFMIAEVPGSTFIELVRVSDTNVHFAYNSRVGIEIPVTNRLSFDAGYRLFGLNGTRVTEADIGIRHIVEGGINYRF